MAYTPDDVLEAAAAINGVRPPDVPGQWARTDAEAALKAVTHRIETRLRQDLEAEFRRWVAHGEHDDATADGIEMCADHLRSAQFSANCREATWHPAS